MQKLNLEGKTIDFIGDIHGHYDALVMSPVMPDNKMFDGENSIKVWLSDDQYKIPLKIKAKMFVGAVEVDIIEYQKGTE